jgi:hypothetical protein
MASTHSAHLDIIAAQKEVDQMSPTQDACKMHDVFCYAALAEVNTRTMHTNLTGAFPFWALKILHYIFVAYVYDIKVIILWPMPSHTNASFINWFPDIFTTLCEPVEK